jgi:CubicO group peptidase (beta-lactamase class C family)
MGAVDEGILHGHCDPEFEPVRQAFLRNFQEDGELGAAVAVTRHGRLVVDLWAGWADSQRTRPWGRDTIVCMMSVGKAVSALAIHMLADRGAIDVDEPIARYWPEFAQNGKGEIPVRWGLSHLAGIPVADQAPPGSIYDAAVMAEAVAAQAPLWTPGTVKCYHSATMGYLCDALVRRVDGRSIGAFVRDEIAGPLGLDYHIGVPPDALARCADMVRARGSLLDLAQTGSKSDLLSRIWKQLPPDEDYNSLAWRQAEIPSANGHGNARSMALLFGALACGGSADGVRLLGRRSLDRALAEQWRGVSISSGLNFRLGLGFFLNNPPDRPMGTSSRAFGHSGAGGAQAIGDPDAGIGFAYSPNMMHGGLDIGVRATRLIEAALGQA